MQIKHPVSSAQYRVTSDSLPDDVVVSVKSVSKKFCKHLRRSMAYGIADLSKNLIGIKHSSNELRKDEFWAVDDISFDLRRGETLGLIGINGSGKTTLLRLLAGIFPPDKGEYMVRGRVGALIALGAGFHPHMTGRENVYLNGSILGLTRSEIDDQFESIVEFSEIGEFINAPVSTYSSGMRVRLGFSIATAIRPDVLLIDEVLAVGDIGFRSKCFNAMDRIAKNAAVIFVSHYLPQVARISSKIMVMDHGKAVYQGENVQEGIAHYSSRFEGPKKSISGSGRAEIHEIEFFSENNETPDEDKFRISYLDDLYVKISFSLNPEIKGAIINIGFFDNEMRGGAEVYSNNCNFEVNNRGDVIKTRVKIPKLPLNPGTYSLTVTIFDERKGEILKRFHAIKDIQVVGSHMGFSSVQLQGEWEFF